MAIMFGKCKKEIKTFELDQGSWQSPHLKVRLALGPMGFELALGPMGSGFGSRAYGFFFVAGTPDNSRGFPWIAP